MSAAGEITPRNPLTGLQSGPISPMEKDWYLSLADAEKVRATMRMLDGSLFTAAPPVPPADTARGTPTQLANSIPGKMPSRANGKLAIEAAWSLEGELKRRPNAKEVMARLQEWANNGTKPDILKETSKDQRGVVWITAKGKENNYDTLALGKTLDTWMKSRN